MKIHYFQRYHQKENVATANTMLLLSRLYSYSSEKFFTFLKSNYFDNNIKNDVELEPIFTIQEKSEKSVPDATISQESFKVVVEAKITDWFHIDQLENHLGAFGNQHYKVLLTLASEPMDENKKTEFDGKLKDYNEEKNCNIVHINTTFETIIDNIREILDDKDYDMLDILDDYFEYCCNDGLIQGVDSWKYMRVQPAGATLKFNIENGVYYDNAERGFRPHDYLGLYKDKRVHAVGKIVARIVASEKDNKFEYKEEYGKITDKRKEAILKAMKDGESYGYDLRNNEHRYFFVDKFHETNFKKKSKGPSRGSRIFDLADMIGIKKDCDAKNIAEMLKDKKWD